MRERTDREPARVGEDAAAQARRALSRLDAWLEERGLKHSRQRNVIVEAFFEMGGHVPVEALVARVRDQDARVSVATVYRTMKLLAECGLAIPRRFDDGQTRYEPAGQRGHHDHLICTGCGQIVEFENERIEELQVRVARSHGFEVESHKLELYGRCQSCRAARRKAKEATP
ncbi:MAG TPA: Fur family transcriptional regulator [Anaeromyxobacteraceae bacterium]|nr:Fur family transcriptional regulator [Anaeromyxobacteraceae bacterium]